MNSARLPSQSIDGGRKARGGCVRVWLSLEMLEALRRRAARSEMTLEELLAKLLRRRA